MKRKSVPDTPRMVPTMAWKKIGQCAVSLEARQAYQPPLNSQPTRSHALPRPLATRVCARVRK